MTKFNYFLGTLFLILTLYLLGSSPESPTYSVDFSSTNSNLSELNDSINLAENSNSAVKINNQARIIFADSTKSKTSWAIVYLHGFTASQMEGDPVHKNIADKYGMNLYLARLSDHGLESDSALYLVTPVGLWETAKTALAIGLSLGDKVIIMSTSTGGTLALKLAQMYPDKVAALINFSPNIQLNNPFAFILNDPWGLSILNMISTDGYVDNYTSSDSLTRQYWTTKYNTEALPQLQELLETTMQKSVFSEIRCPVLTLAYYKDEAHQDPTVKVSGMRWMHECLGTDERLKSYIELSDVGVHPLASGLRSEDIISVEIETSIFIDTLLLIKN